MFELKARILLVSVVQRLVPLRRVGNNHKGCCPFHDDRDPSLVVYADHFHCYGCSAHGDVIDWLFRIEGVSFPEAVVRLAGEVGLLLPDNANRGQFVRKITPTKLMKDEGEWRPEIPPPANAPEPATHQLHCDMLHVYRDALGAPLFYVRRWEAKVQRRKSFVPLTWGYLREPCRQIGRSGWHDKAPHQLRPLYGLDRLAANPNAEVLICEGEKSTDAAQRLCPDKVCVGWMGGAGAVDQADWSPLQQRSTAKIMWPDADASGLKAAAQVAIHLPDVRVLNVDALPDGHDAADLEAECPENPETWLRERTPTYGTSR